MSGRGRRHLDNGRMIGRPPCGFNMRIDRADSEAELLGAPASNAEIVKVVAGDFEVRLADSAAEIDAAQALRYRVFYER